MMTIAVLVKQPTLRILEEHSTHDLGDALSINETEALVLLTADTLRRLLDLARPEDTRIDDVIMRMAL